MLNYNLARRRLYQLQAKISGHVVYDKNFVRRLLVGWTILLLEDSGFELCFAIIEFLTVYLNEIFCKRLKKMKRKKC